MGATPRYELPYPEPSALARDGSTAIRALAEAIEDNMTARRGRAYRASSNYAIPHAAVTDLPTNQIDAAFSTVEFTVSGGNLVYTGPSVVVLVTAWVEWEGSGSGYRRVIIRKNAVNDTMAQVDPDTDLTKHSVAGILTLASGDSVGIGVRQTSGGSLNIADADLRVVTLGLL